MFREPLNQKTLGLVQHMGYSQDRLLIPILPHTKPYNSFFLTIKIKPLINNNVTVFLLLDYLYFSTN